MRQTVVSLTVFLMLTSASIPAPAALDADAIGNAAGAAATTAADGVVRIGWSRDDVAVQVDGMPFRPQAGLGSWAAFKETPEGAMVMGDTVVFQDEVDAAMDAAFEGGLEITALHNHFFYDDPKVYFMHIGGRGAAVELARGVKAMWDAVKDVRRANAVPAKRFGGRIPEYGVLDAAEIGRIIGVQCTINNGVAKASVPREGTMNGTTVGGSMGLSSWAAFSGSDDLAAMDGDIIMTADEVQSTLKRLRKAGVHIVALHNHMIGDEPAFFFTHFWATGPAAELAAAFKSAL